LGRCECRKQAIVSDVGVHKETLCGGFRKQSRRSLAAHIWEGEDLKASDVSSKDLVAGLVFITIGMAFLWVGLDYHVGTARQMGPGFFPVALSVLLTGLGVAIALKALAAGRNPIVGVNFRGMGFVIGATAGFGLLIRPAGMLIAVFVLTAVGAIASSQFRASTSVLLATGLSVFCIVVFNWGLGMPFPVLGYWLQ
jgi:hypothetical protein